MTINHSMHIQYFFNMNKRTIIAISFLCCISSWGYSQNTCPITKTLYFGTDIGTSIGNSSFKSFGVNKTNIGLKVGAFGGFYINRFLSTELSLNYSNMKLSAYDCCQNLWLCENNRYFAPVSGKQNYAYADLYSNINLYEIGSKLNIDFIRMKHPNAKLMATLSPSLSLITSNAKVNTLFNEQNVRSGNQLHIGIGTEAGVGYRFNKNIALKLYSALTYLTNKNFDGMPNADHKTNFVWNQGIKLIFSLNKKECKKEIPTVIESTPIIPEQINEVKVETKDVTDNPIIEIKKDTIQPTAPKAVNNISDRIIYFKLNQHRIFNKEQIYELNAIVELMKSDTQCCVSIDGWADKSGAKEWNELLSLKRAKFIKDTLIRNGIDENRILYIKGNGVDYQNNGKPSDARKTVIKIVATEKTK